MLERVMKGAQVALKKQAAREWARRNLPPYLEAFNADTLKICAEQNRDIMPAILKDVTVDRGKHSDWVETLADADFLLELLESVSPEHARVLRDFPQWYSWQIKKAGLILLGSE